VPVLIERAVNAEGDAPGVDVESHVGPSLQEDPLPGETPLPYAAVRETPREDISVQNHPAYLRPDQGEEPPNDKWIKSGDVETRIGTEVDDANYPGQDTKEYAEQWTARKEAEAERGPNAPDLPPVEAPFVGNTIADSPEEVPAALAEMAEGDEADNGTTTDDAEVDTDTEPTKAELLEEARDLDIEGRSTMTKDELAEAVEEARSDGGA
jgi:hypothetical protein